MNSTPHIGNRTARAWRKLLAMALLCAAPLGTPEATTQAPVAREYEVKAAYLPKFAEFVEWPGAMFPAADTPIIIGVLGEDPFGSILDRVVHGAKVKERPLMVKRFKRVEDARGCHLLFVSRSEKARIPQILAECRKTGILTVGDTERFAHRGGIINLVFEGRTIGYEINRDSAEESGITISYKLLRFAREVISMRKKGGP